MDTELRFHPLSLLTVIILMPIITLINSSLYVVIALLCVSCIVFLVYKKYKMLITYLTIFTVVVLINELVNHINNEFLVLYIGMTAFMVSRLLPVAMIGNVLSNDVMPGEIISAFQQLKVPKGIIISFIVALRFLPIYSKEVEIIRSCLKMRGIKISIFKPLQALEYTMVPALFRGATIAEEMSASAMTKAIESNNKRTSIYTLKIRWIDTLVVLIVFSACILLILPRLKG